MNSPTTCKSAYDFTARDIHGHAQPLHEFRGDVLLIVNVASKCGFTPQYRGLQQLWHDYRARGFAVLGFPCDQFGAQEPGSEADIREFCSLNYAVDFPMFAKVDVNGANAHPLWQWLQTQKSGVLGRRIKWNFSKFLIARDGQVLHRYAPLRRPDAMRSDIERALGG